jgi:hypothetical protein
MATNQPDQQAQLTALKALTAMLQSQLQALQNNPVVAPPIVFAQTPSLIKGTKLLDYGVKTGSIVYVKGCKPLFEGDKRYNGTTEGLATYLTALDKHALDMGWSCSSNPQQIVLFDLLLPDGTTTIKINIITEYARITMYQLTFQCARFMTGVDKEMRANQNNHMMQKCMWDSLTTEFQLKLATYKKVYTMDGLICAPLLHKVIMRVAIMDSVATNKLLREQMNNLLAYAVEVKGDVDAMTAKFKDLWNRLLASGTPPEAPEDTLFKALMAGPCEKFNKYIEDKEDLHNDGTLKVTPDELIILAMQKYHLMTTKGEFNISMPVKEKIIAMQAKLVQLKGKLTLAESIKKAANVDAKIKTSNKTCQKADEEWKKIPSGAGEPSVKKIKNKDFHWCIHHMAWTVHLPDECCLCPNTTAIAPSPSAATAVAA